MRLCEACGLELAVEPVLVRVGACDFPFFLHEGCRQAMAPVTAAIEDMCQWAEDQPEGLVCLGSWSPSADEKPDDPGARSDEQSA